MADPIFLFTGPEFGERNDAVEDVKKSLRKKFGDLDEHLFYLVETPLYEIMTLLQGGNLFSSATCIVVRGAEAIKKKEEIKMIEDWLASKPEDSQTLILVSDEISVDSKLDKLVPASNKKKFWEMFEDRKLPWLQSYFKKNGYQISEDACTDILDLVQNNTESLKNECSRFFLVFPKDHKITTEDVEKILSHNREENAFTLFNKMADNSLDDKKRFEDSLEILQKMRLSKENNSVMIIAGLTSCFRKLIAYHKIISSNPYPDDITFKQNGISGKMQQKQYRNASKIWTIGQTTAVLSLLSQTDMQIRNSGTLLEDNLLTLMLYSIIVKHGKSAESYEL